MAGAAPGPAVRGHARALRRRVRARLRGDPRDRHRRRRGRRLSGLGALAGAGRRPLCVGIGGGGDVVGALGLAEVLRELGADPRLGGVTWERRPVDPVPGPRRLAELRHAEPLNAATALAGPETCGPGGARFAETRVAALTGRPVLLVDPWPAPAAVAEALVGAAARLRCDALLLVDVGGDALARGDEAGLGSPLCDAVLLAAGAAAAARLPVLGAVFGAGCDGELTPAEVLDRFAVVARAGGARGALGLTPAAAGALEAAVRAVPTEASAQALACARGETGTVPIRDGRRTVERTPVGGLGLLFDCRAALRAGAPLAAAVSAAEGLEDANRRLHALGVSTELDWERRHRGGASQAGT